MRRYHHIGIPTSQPRPGERHVEHLKTFIVGHENSEYGVEWMRFEADAPIPELVRQVPHVAFEVSDLASELVGREILIAPNNPSDGVRVAFIVENGAPIELLEFTDPNHPDRRWDDLGDQIVPTAAAGYPQGYSAVYANLTQLSPDTNGARSSSSTDLDSTPGCQRQAGNGIDSGNQGGAAGAEEWR
jgi:hypothetical protein